MTPEELAYVLKSFRAAPTAAAIDTLADALEAAWAERDDMREYASPDLTRHIVEMSERAERAEAALARVRELYAHAEAEVCAHYGDRGCDPYCDCGEIWWQSIRDAIEGEQK